MKQLHGAALDSWPDANEKGRMESQRLCAYNETKQSLLGMDIVAGDFSDMSLRDWMARLTPETRAGLRLIPFRGIPEKRVSSPLDLIYLDVHCRVIDIVEFFPYFPASASAVPAASVLVLPSHSIHTSRTGVGDRLVISTLDEMRGRQGLPPNYNESAYAALVAGRRPILMNKHRPLTAGADDIRMEDLSGTAQSTRHPRKRDISLKSDTVNQEPRRSWLARWFIRDGEDRTKQKRREPATGLTAFFWTGGSPKAHVIRDINSSGMYVKTSERWYIGTVIRMTLSMASGQDSGPVSSICVHAEAINWGNDGVDLRFVVPDDPKQIEDLPQAADGADRNQLESFLAMWRKLWPKQSLTNGEGGSTARDVKEQHMATRWREMEPHF